MVGRLTTLPHGSGWIDAYTFVDGARTLVGHPDTLYDPVRAQLVSSLALRVYVHPPAGLLAFLPLVPVAARFGTPTAAGIWVVADAGCLLAAVVLMARHARIGPVATGGAILAAAVTAWSLDEVGSGQVNGLVLLLVALAWRDLPRDRAGIWIGLSVAVKPVAPLILLVPLLRGRWRMGLLAIAAGAAANAVLLPVIGLPQAWLYASGVLPFFARFSVTDVNNLSPTNLLMLVLGGRHPAPGSAAATPVNLPGLAEGLSAAFRVGLALLCLRAIRRAKGDDWGMALALAAAPLCTATVWAHYYLLLIPLAILGTAQLSRPRRTAVLVGVLLSGAAIYAQYLSLAGMGMPNDQRTGVPQFELYHGVAVWVGVGRALAFCLICWGGATWAFLRAGRRRPPATEPRVPVTGPSPADVAAGSRGASPISSLG